MFTSEFDFWLGQFAFHTASACTTVSLAAAALGPGCSPHGLMRRPIERNYSSTAAEPLRFLGLKLYWLTPSVVEAGFLPWYNMKHNLQLFRRDHPHDVDKWRYSKAGGMPIKLSILESYSGYHRVVKHSSTRAIDCFIWHHFGQLRPNNFRLWVLSLLLSSVEKYLYESGALRNIQ